MYQKNAEYDATSSSISAKKHASGKVESNIFNIYRYHIVLW
jgi:hypothetical protein